MGPPRRNHSGYGNVSAQIVSCAARSTNKRAQPSVQAVTPEPSAVAVYWNVGVIEIQSQSQVLRRRDPFYSVIFDQFSHVCVYHHNGSKMEKQGFEHYVFV